MEFREAMNILEAILFASGDSVSKAKLCEVMEIDEALLSNVAQELGDHYDYEMRGLKLLELDNAYQLCSRADYSKYVRGVLETRKPNPLSQAALEVLAIVAYKQPVTKVYIEQVRGVDSTYTMHSLIEKELITSCGKLDVPGKPTLYKTTEGFLRAFGISNLDDLPNVKEFSKDDPEQLAFNVLMPEDPQ